MRISQVFLAAVAISGLVVASGPARAEWDDDDGWRHHEFHEQLRHERADRWQARREQRWQERYQAPAYIAGPPVHYAPPPVYYAAPPAYYAPPPPVFYAPRRPAHREPGFSIGFEFR